MFCLLQLLLFYVFHGVYLGGVSVFGYVVLSCVDTPMVLYAGFCHDKSTSQNECFTIFSPTLCLARMCCDTLGIDSGRCILDRIGPANDRFEENIVA